MEQIGRTSELVSIHRAFAVTEYGKKLAGDARYNRYKPDFASNSEWQELLGVDVNNLGHLHLTANLTRAFIREMQTDAPGSFVEDDEWVLVAAAFIHDWAESITDDITFSDKTAEHTEIERAHFHENLASFLPEASPWIEELVAKALGEVIFSEEGELSQAFNAIERVGYMRTALRAATYVINDKAPAGFENGMRWLAADVFTNQPSKLIDYSVQFPPVKRYLLAQSDLISATFRVTQLETFSNYPSQQREKKYMDFQQNFMKWRQWLIRNSLSLGRS